MISEKLLDAYKHGYVQLTDELEGLTDEQCNFKPSSDSWSIKEIVIHVTDAELVHIHRMKAVISEDNPLLTAFDQDAWSKQLQYSALNHHTYLSLFKVLRESFVPVLQNLNLEQFNRVGTHNTAGPLTLEQILVHTIEHVTDHIQQIKRVKAVMSNSEDL